MLNHHCHKFSIFGISNVFESGENKEGFLQPWCNIFLFQKLYCYFSTHRVSTNINFLWLRDIMLNELMLMSHLAFQVVQIRVFFYWWQDHVSISRDFSSYKGIKKKFLQALKIFANLVTNYINWVTYKNNLKFKLLNIHHFMSKYFMKIV